MEIPRHDADREEDPTDIDHDSGTLAITLLTLCDIAERECTAEQLAAARQEHRAWMLEHGIGKPLEALAIRLAEMGPAPVKARGLVVHAAKAALEEGRSDRDVSTQDAAREERKAKGPKRSPRSTSWISRIGATVTAYCVEEEVEISSAAVLRMLTLGAFARPASTIGPDPAFGWCRLDEPTQDIREMLALPVLGGDPELVVFGLRRDAKTGCPTARFRLEAERQAEEEAHAAGRKHPFKDEIKAILDDLVAAWYRTATPQTAVFPVVWHRASGTLYIHTDNTAAVDAAASLLRRDLGAARRVMGVLEQPSSVELENLSRTDLRRDDLVGEGGASLLGDVLLWLLARQLGGTGVVALSGDRGKLEWWLEDGAVFERDTADDKRLTVKLAGAPAEGGSLAAALADGASPTSARLTLRLVEDERKWSVTLGGANPCKWKLPALCKPDGSPTGLDAAINERLRLYRQGADLLDVLLTAAIGDRFDGGTWRQRMNALRRCIGIEMVKHWGFDAASGQGILFADMLPGRQGTFADVTSEEPTGQSRGAKARAESATN